jgi:ATP-dependent metalloprotease FtsH
MFTSRVRQLLDQAKATALVRGDETLSMDALLDAVGHHAEARALLARCLPLSLEDLRGQYMDMAPQGTLYGGQLPLSSAVRTLLEDAQRLAAAEPDRTHPGLIAMRHLACAVAMSAVACEQLGVAPLDETAATEQLQAWHAGDAALPVLDDLTEQMRVLRAELLSRVFGQDHAVHAFVEGIFNANVVVQADEERKGPRAIFLFAGPPGVGKTYLAELSASYLGKPFKRFDMSEFSDHQQHMQLVGFPPSYKSAQAGTLTGYVAEHPECILLFDEIEKAHLNTIHLFLQILDAGRLEDKFTGETVPFRDTLIILTTNAGRALYDSPNETGVTTANASFHRRTILDAIRTEEGPSGQPFFPAALCSRLATGYPILFNYLGVNELEKIARREMQRVAELFENQYYKTIHFDEALPLMLVLREGANTDARTVRAQSDLFVKTELFKFADLFKKGRLESMLGHIDVIDFALDAQAQQDETVTDLLKGDRRSKIMLVAAEGITDMFEEHLPEIEWLTASTAKDALQILANTEVDLVLLDIWVGREVKTMSGGSFIGTAHQFDYVPAGARALSEGQDCLEAIHERLPELPVYLLSFVEGQNGRGTVDEHLFLACVRSGGARGILDTHFTNDVEEGWQTHRDDLMHEIRDLAQRMYREERAQALGQEHKVLNFDTVPRIDRRGRSVTIRLRDLRLTRAISAEDSNELLEDVERPSVRFNDVFGAEAAKEALTFIVDWLKNPRHYAALGIKPPKGILLTGPPGTGKTLLARALAGESDVAFLVASGTDFVTIWQGSGPQNIRELFKRGRRYAPSIIFIDEIDAIGKKRGSIGGAGRAEESTLNALLTEIDGFNAPMLRPTILLAATNLAEHLDDALLRRFDRVIEVPPPDREARAAYLRRELLDRKMSQVTEELVDMLARRSARMTIANLQRVINEAAVMAARQDSALTDAIVEEAFEKIRMGEAKETPDSETLERIARHEAGHALVSWLTGNRPVQVTIVGRGGAGGYVEKEIEEEKIIYTRTDLEHMICQAMAGRAAELVYYGDVDGLSTGVGSDLKHASQWAERMIREFGMSEDVGQIFFDRRYLQDGPLAVKVSDAAEDIVDAQLKQAQTMLQEHKQALDDLATALLEKNRLTRADLENILGDIGP